MEKKYQIIPKFRLNLPEFPKNKKGTLFLDLDETLMTTLLPKEHAEHKINLRNN